MGYIRWNNLLYSYMQQLLEIDPSYWSDMEVYMNMVFLIKSA